MTPLRQRMTEDMQLAGYSSKTQQAYVSAVRQLFAHFKCNPSQLSEEQLRQYFLYLTNERKVSRPTVTIALCGIKFFFERTLEKDWTTFNLVRPAPEKKLARHPQPGGSAPDSRSYQTAALPSLSDDDLFVRPALAGRHAFTGGRYRFRTDGSPHPWEGRQGQVCAPAGSHIAAAA